MDLIQFEERNNIENLILKHTIKVFNYENFYSDLPIYSAYINLSNLSREIKDEDLNYQRNRPRDQQKLIKLYTYLCSEYKEYYPTTRWEIIFGSVNNQDLKLLDGAHRVSVSRNLIDVISRILIYDFKSEEERFNYFKIINESSDLAEYYRRDINDEIIELQSQITKYIKDNNYINDTVDYWKNYCHINWISTPFLRTDKVDPIIGKIINNYFEDLSELDKCNKTFSDKYYELIEIIEWINKALSQNSNKYIGSFLSYKSITDRTTKCRAIKKDNIVCNNSNKGGNEIDRCGTHKDPKRFKLTELPQYEKLHILAKESKCGLGFIFNENEASVMYSVYKEHKKLIL